MSLGRHLLCFGDCRQAKCKITLTDGGGGGGKGLSIWGGGHHSVADGIQYSAPPLEQPLAHSALLKHFSPMAPLPWILLILDQHATAPVPAPYPGLFTEIQLCVFVCVFARVYL